MKDLLLFMFDLQTPKEMINQVMKYDNQLFQHSWNSPKYSYSYSTASTTISNSQPRIEDMQINAIQYKPHKKRNVFLMEACVCIVEKVVIRPTLPYVQNKERNHIK